MIDDNVNYENAYHEEEPPKRPRHYRRLLWLLFIPLIVATVAFGYYYVEYASFPKPAGLKENKFTWQYKSQSYSMSVPLYQSIEKYYDRQPKGIFTGLENASIKKYFHEPKADQEIPELASELKNLAIKGNLDSDQTAELAVAFVQAIPYDNARAKTDLTHPWYPYETLYADQGICSDKTILMVSILRQLGYGSAAFMYEKQQHMAAAISCPKGYSNYNSGYCIIETTAVGHKIGIIPEINQDLIAVPKSQVQEFGQTSPDQNVQLTTPDIVATTTGTTYQGVIQTIENENSLNTLSQFFVTQKAAIDSKEATLSQLKSQLDAYRAANNVTAYNNLVPTYNKTVEDIQAMVNAYNSNVTVYNNLLTQ